MATKRSGREPEYDFYTLQENTGSGNIPAFLSKLWNLVDDPTNDEIICWDSHGMSFHIYDQSRFAAEVLPFYFKHNNISSFIRQLNMYGFRKVPNMEQGGLKVERDNLEFQHPYFMRGHEDLLERIKRKTGQARVEQRPVNMDTDSLTKVLNEVAKIKSKQDTFNNTMESLKRENQILWREVIKLTKKYQQQQQIISKIMHFLLSLVNKHGRGMPGIPRKRPLMINAPEPSGSSEPSPPKKANIVLNEAGDHDYTIQSPSDILESPAVQPNTSGVVIQELLDHLDPPQNPPRELQTSRSSTTVRETAQPVAAGPAETVTELLFPESSASTLFPTQVESPASQQPLQPPTLPEQPKTSQQIALRGIKDKPLSSGTSPVSVKDVAEQMKLLQCDMDNVREVLSSGQFNLDHNFILGLFDPEAPLQLDSSLMDLLNTEGNSADLPTPSTLPVPSPEDSVSGNELSQYQPEDLSIPSLFDELDTGVGSVDSSVPVFFDNENSGLNTPAVPQASTSLFDSHIKPEDLD